MKVSENDLTSVLFCNAYMVEAGIHKILEVCAVRHQQWVHHDTAISVQLLD